MLVDSGETHWLDDQGPGFWEKENPASLKEMESGWKMGHGAGEIA